MSWQEQTSMMSPRQERAFWLAVMKRRAPHGMAVNCRHMPSLDRTPQLVKLIEDGLIIRTRESRGGNCNRTILKLPEGI